MYAGRANTLKHKHPEAPSVKTSIAIFLHNLARELIFMPTCKRNNFCIGCKKGGDAPQWLRRRISSMPGFNCYCYLYEVAAQRAPGQNCCPVRQ